MVGTSVPQFVDYILCHAVYIYFITAEKITTINGIPL
jgi:hypothetical protein